jgi:hypothetical protein
MLATSANCTLFHTAHCSRSHTLTVHAITADSGGMTTDQLPNNQEVVAIVRSSPDLIMEIPQV